MKSKRNNNNNINSNNNNNNDNTIDSNIGKKHKQNIWLQNEIWNQTENQNK